MAIRTHEDISNLYTKYPGHPTYVTGLIETNDVVDVVIQKLEMILFTNKGETSDPGFGADMERLLWSTNLASESIKSELISQISKYVQELNTSMYEVTVELYEGTTRDIGIVTINISGSDIVAFFS